MPSAPPEWDSNVNFDIFVSPGMASDLQGESLILRVNEIKAPDGSDYRGKVVPDARKNLLRAFEASVHMKIQILQKSGELKKAATPTSRPA